MAHGSRRGPVGVLAIVGVVTIAACGGSASSSPPAASVIIDATTSAESARVQIVEHLSASGSGPILAAEASGTIDFARQRGETTEKLLPTSPPPKSPASTTAVSASAAVSQVRWIGNDVYSDEASPSNLAPVGSKTWTLLDGNRIHAALPCIAADEVAALDGSSNNPSTVLEMLRREGVTFVRVGAEDVRGTATTHWHSAARTSTPKSCPPSNHVQRSTKETIDVWTDRDNRARRIHVLATTTTPPQSEPLPAGVTGTTFRVPAQTTTADSTTEFFDFGTPVTVDAPPANEVDDATDSWIAMMKGTGTVRAGDWHVAAHGTLNSGPWSVYVARTSTGWLCYDAPGTQQGLMDALAISDNFPKHGKDESQCALPGAGAGSGFSLGVFQALINTTDAGRRIVVGVSTSPGAVRMVLADGTTHPLTVDPATRVVMWSQPAAASPPVHVEVGDVTCRIDGKGDALGDPARIGSAQESTCAGAAPTPLTLPLPAGIQLPAGLKLPPGIQLPTGVQPPP